MWTRPRTNGPRARPSKRSRACARSAATSAGRRQEDADRADHRVRDRNVNGRFSPRRYVEREAPALAGSCHNSRHTLRDAVVCRLGTHMLHWPRRNEALRVGRGEEQRLKADRGIGFEDIVFHIERGDLLDILEHPNPERYAGQRISSCGATSTCTLVPFVEDGASIFLKTIIPSRKATKQYLGQEPDDDEA